MKLLRQGIPEIADLARRFILVERKYSLAGTISWSGIAVSRITPTEGGGPAVRNYRE